MIESALESTHLNLNLIPHPELPVLVIGSAAQDVVGHPEDGLQPSSSSPGRIRKSFGGVSRNIAENLVRLGHPVTLLTAVGMDRTGDQLLEEAAGIGVNVDFVRRTDRFPTATYMACVDVKGQLQFALADMRVISSLTPAYIEEHADLFEVSSLIFVDANLSKPALRKVFSLARKAKIPVCADPTSIELAERLTASLPKITLVSPNLAEAEILCSQTFGPIDRNPALEAAKCLVRHGVRIAIVAHAEYGVCYASAETSGKIPALRIQTIDPTGVGDAMTAAVLFALLNDIPLDDSIRLGVSAASLTLRHSGSVVPDLSLEKLYDQLVI